MRQKRVVDILEREEIVGRSTCNAVSRPRHSQNVSALESPAA